VPSYWSEALSNLRFSPSTAVLTAAAPSIAVPILTAAAPSTAAPMLTAAAPSIAVPMLNAAAPFTAVPVMTIDGVAPSASAPETENNDGTCSAFCLSFSGSNY
jgi:hypothetical protein